MCRTRLVVLLVSTVLAVAGWAGSVLLLLTIETNAGADGVYVLALSVGITFTITACHSAVMPDKMRAYGLGHRDGYAAATARQEAPSGQRAPLSLVRH